MKKYSEDELSLLHAVYEFADDVHGSKWACQKGCCTCCTQSVTMTTLESIEIVNFLKENGEEPAFEKLCSAATRVVGPARTVNSFAAFCLKGGEEEESRQEPDWNLNPCLFLQNGSCIIYPVRPFACRCFLSQSSCLERGYAVVDAKTISFNTVLQQIIEHLDAGGGWGNMVHILVQAGAKNCKHFDEQILPCETLPGFVVPPEERGEVNGLVNSLFQKKIGQDKFVEVMKRVGLRNR